jgi:nicotinate-nucleotide adenylyltransferase
VIAGRSGPRPSRIYAGVPPHGAGQRIGLYGGSFNPPHAGHRHVSLVALNRLALDQIWWLVSPGNPLKDPSALMPFEARLRRAAEVAAHPRIAVTGAESVFGTRYTADIVCILVGRASGDRFVWIMGSDNLAQLDRWERWRDIAAMAPIAVVNRPRHLLSPLSSRAAQALRSWRVPEEDAPRLADMPPPAWCFIVAPRTDLSSTALRKADGTS